MYALLLRQKIWLAVDPDEPLPAWTVTRDTFREAMRDTEQSTKRLNEGTCAEGEDTVVARQKP